MLRLKGRTHTSPNYLCNLIDRPFRLCHADLNRTLTSATSRTARKRARGSAALPVGLSGNLLGSEAERLRLHGV
eukprot:1695521-Heterocapsa_arctica.AAC.1